MSEYLLLAAMERARELVGEGVWEKLSQRTRTNAVRQELRKLDVERITAIMAPKPKDAYTHV